MRMHTRIVLLLAAAGLLPLLLYGAIAAHFARRGAERAVTAATATVASQVSARLAEFVRGRVDVISAAGAAVQSRQAQARSILGHVLLADKTIRYLALYDSSGELLESTYLPSTGISEQASAAAALSLDGRKPVVTPVGLGDDLLPVMAVAVPLNVFGELEGVLVAEVDTLEIWALVRDIRLGATGYAYVQDENGRLIAHGDPRRLEKVISEEAEPLPRVAVESGVAGLVYQRTDGVPVVGAASHVPGTSLLVVVEMPAEEAFFEARRIGWMLVLTLAVTLSLLVGVTWRGARLVSRPVESLARAASALGSGDFSVRVAESERDEIGHLGQVFNRMAMDLERLSADIRRHERESLLGRIAGGLAHDLKRPFQHIITHVRTFLDLPSDPRVRELVERALDREQEYVNRLFGDLARFSKDERLELQPTLLPDLVSRVEQSLLPAAEAAGSRLEVCVDGEFGSPVMLDPVAIERVIRNLVENAIDAGTNREGHRIELTVREQDSGFNLTVKDNGPGFPDDLLPTLFETFRTTKRSGSGLGLGLAVVRRIAETHGGTAHAENLAGEGALVTIYVPSSARQGDEISPGHSPDRPDQAA